MELFGVQELPNSKSISAPGWAYVPDTGINPSVAALQPSRAKRVARILPNASGHEKSAKQDAKILRELAALDRENHKDVQITIPIKHRNNAGRVNNSKATPAVRKILQSQKTFANHLSDAEALAALSTPLPQSQAAPSTPLTTPASRSSPAVASTGIKGTGKRGGKRKSGRVTSTSTPLRQVSTPVPGNEPSSETYSKGDETQDSSSSAIPIDAKYGQLLKPLPEALELPPHIGDIDPLLMSRVPPLPSQAELEALIAAPPLTYVEARGEFTAEDLRRQTRSFCEICGYWGRAGCTKCGSRVCALECLRLHQEDCYTRYGA